MNYEDAKICSSCLDIYGFFYTDNGVFYQKCDSECHHRDLKAGMPPSEKKQARWDGFDFNEVATLCYGCGAALLRSGSRWSVWFCGTCKKRVSVLNQEMGEAVIPIGRHTLMNGIELKLEPEQKTSVSKRKTREFADSFLQFGNRIDRLAQWKKISISQNCRAAEFVPGHDVGLMKYLSSLNGLNKESSFEGMKGFILK